MFLCTYAHPLAWHTEPSMSLSTPNFLNPILIWNTLSTSFMWVSWKSFFNAPLCCGPSAPFGSTYNKIGTMHCGPSRNLSLRPRFSPALDCDPRWSPHGQVPCISRPLSLQAQHSALQNGQGAKRREGSSGQLTLEGRSSTVGRTRGSGLKSQRVVTQGQSLNFLNLNFSTSTGWQW